METWILALSGGALIGLAGSLLLTLDGRIAGVSGILGGTLRWPRRDLGWRLVFLLGLVVGGLVLRAVDPSFLAGTPVRSPSVLVAGGLLMGAGSRIGNGCTSGHGVCGISRGSVRSIVATLVFMATGMITAVVAARVGA